MIILFILDNLSVIVMRESHLHNYRPKFKVPLYPYLQILAIISYIVLLVTMGLVPLLISGAFLIAGILVYFAYSRKRINRTSALMHIIERISAKEIQSTGLESELREILLHRDEIIEDRFDKLIKECDILDIEGQADLDSVIDTISTLFEQKCHVSKDLMIEGFKEREKQSSTIIKPGLAIPHIIIPGETCFNIIPVRCKDGIRFEGAEEPVRTMFVLIGSLDERPYHLRALMAIANLVQEKDFEKRWMSARNTDELRDVILLSNRTRES
jgi:mannitol/fructose-specific phosphotransferase system IIA component (Ntr-type)